MVEIYFRHFDIKGKLPSHFVKVSTDLTVIELFLKKDLYIFIRKVKIIFISLKFIFYIDSIYLIHRLRYLSSIL